MAKISCLCSFLDFATLLKVRHLLFTLMAPHGKELSQDLKYLISETNKKNKSQRQFAKVIGKRPASIQKIIKKFQAEASTYKARSLRSGILTNRECCTIVRKVKEH